MSRPRKKKFELKRTYTRRTKAFSCTQLEWTIFERFAVYAKSQGRSESSQLIIIINKFLAEQQLIDELNDLAKPKKSLHVCGFPDGSQVESSKSEKDNIYISEKMNSLGGGLPVNSDRAVANISPGAADGLFTN